MTQNISIREKFPSIENIQELVEFETWWNKNLVMIVNGSHRYTNWLIVYEPSQKNASEKLLKFEVNFHWENSWYVLRSAKENASQARVKLGGSCPISQIHPRFNTEDFFQRIICSPYVEEIGLPVTTYGIYGPMDKPIDDPWNYLKPLDIVKVKRSCLLGNYYHFGIYKGNGEMCHFSDPNAKKCVDNNCVRITNWRTFLGDYHSDLEVIRIRCLVPFMHFQWIAGNIAWDVCNNFGLRRYCLANNNCEHYVYSRIFGIKFSEQVSKDPLKALKYAHHSRLTDYGKCDKCKNEKFNDGKSSYFTLKKR